MYSDSYKFSIDNQDWISDILEFPTTVDFFYNGDTKVYIHRWKHGGKRHTQGN